MESDIPTIHAAELAASSPHSAGAQAAMLTSEQGKEPFVSAGKTIHNEITYRGIDFLLNSTIGVLFTYWTARTKSGAALFGKPVNGFFKTILKPALKSEKALDEGAKWGSMFTSIIVGGTAIIPPMTWMEDKDNKKALIRSFDETIYGKDTVENDPKFAASYQAIDNEPKKDFKTGMAARIAVLIPMIAVTLHHGTNKYMVQYLYNPIAKGSKALCKKLHIQPKSLMEKGRVEIADGDISAAPRFLSDWDFIHRTVGFDLGLTFIYSFAHEAAYKSFAKFFNQEQKNESAQLAMASTIPEIHDEAPAKQWRTSVKDAPKNAPFTELAKKQPAAEGLSA